MPIYEYRCEKCKRVTELIQRIGERPIKRCPHCGGKVKKVASAPAIQFKGSGFYITDYARARQEEKKTGGEKAEKAEKVEKAEKGEKAEKSEKAEKAEKPAEKKPKKKD